MWQAAADVGVSIYTGTDVAIAAAAIVLMQDSLLHLVTAIDLARATCRRIRFNLLFSMSYNLIGIPMSAGVLYPWLHIQVGAGSPLFCCNARLPACPPQVPPTLAGFCMAFSSVTVVGSSLLLKRYIPPIGALKERIGKVRRFRTMRA